MSPNAKQLDISNANNMESIAPSSTTTMSKKTEIFWPKLSPLAKVMLITCFLASLNQLFSILLTYSNLNDNNNKNNSAASVMDNANVLRLVQQKQEENELLEEQIKQKQEMLHQQERQYARIEQERRKREHEQRKQQQQQEEDRMKNSVPSARPRVLFGIFTFDHTSQFHPKNRFRSLFDVFIQNDDYRVCSLGNFETAVHKLKNGELTNVTTNTTTTTTTTAPKFTSQNNNDEQNDYFYKKTYEHCQYIYTFVIGANVSQHAPTLIGAPIHHNTHDYLLYPRSLETLHNHSLKEEYQNPQQWTDMTLLNIQENMNDGKSQTWFHYGALVAKQLDIDYVGKADMDTIPYLDRFFDWVNIQKRLPPYPYNKNIIVGNPVNKDWWWQDITTTTTTTATTTTTTKLTAAQEHKEHFFKDNYDNNFHVYAQGQCYLLSVDLAWFVAQESQRVWEEGQYDLLRKKRIIQDATAKEENKAKYAEEMFKRDWKVVRHELRSKGNFKYTYSNYVQDNGRELQKVFNKARNLKEINDLKLERLESTPPTYDDYIEGHEDHDVSSMAFHSPYPIQFQFLTRYQLFWRHGVKNKRGNNAANKWSDEIQRLREWVPLHTNMASVNWPKGDPIVEKNSLAYTTSKRSDKTKKQANVPKKKGDQKQ